ncbi:hypothetical protein [Campylobacter ureolyticus]|uniref:hypothetical protein n=1 Tax=Campylobacter ureolyticus TaxID=827 RepID=UPI002889FED3|nr:hypothetical protein [Campylobacter ureolyticus]
MAIAKLTPEEFLNFGKVATNSAPKIKKLSANEWLEYGNEDKNKSFLRDMWSGHVNNVNKYYSSITKGLSKGAKSVGLDGLSNFLDSESTYSSYIANKENKKINNQIAGLAGDIIGDPLNLFGGLGIVNKANKLKKASTLAKAKEISKGAGVLGAFGAGASALRDYGDDSVKNDEMLKNMAIGGAIGAGLGGGIVSGVPQHYFKKGYDAIKSKFTKPVPLPKANIVPYDETFAKNQAQNSEFIKGDGFVMDKKGRKTYPYNAFMDLEDVVVSDLKLPRNEVRASLSYLYNNHPEMFENKGDVYRTMLSLKNNHNYRGDSFKDPNVAYMAQKIDDKKMSDMAISRETNGIIHLNKNKDMSGKDKAIFNQQVAGTVNPQHRQLVSVPQMNTSKEHFSPAVNDSIIPNQSLNQNITKDDILKEIVNLRNQGFKFGNNMDENLNLVLNKIKNDRLNTTSAKNAQVPNNELLPPPNQLDNPNMKKGFVTPNVALNIASAGVGSVVGARADEENRLRGAMLGGLGGLGGKYALGKISNSSYDKLNTAIGNQIGSAVSGGAVGGIYNSEYDSRGNIDWKKTLAGVGVGALAGIGLKNSPKIINKIENSAINKEILKEQANLSDFLQRTKKDKALLEQNLKDIDYKLKNMPENKNSLNNKKQEDLLIKKANLTNELNVLNNSENEILSKIQALKINANNPDEFKRLTGFMGGVRGAFTNTFSSEFKALRDKATSNISAVTKDIENINSLFANMDEKKRKLLGQALSNSDIKLNKTDQDMISSFRKMIDENNEQLYKLGILDKDTFNEFRGKYVSREYDLGLKDKFKNMSKVGFGLEKIQERGTKKTFTKSEFQALKDRGEVARYGSGEFGKKWTYYADKDGMPITNKDGSIELRRDLTKSERISKKENTDIGIILGKTLYRQNELLTHARYLKSIEEYGNNLAKNKPNSQQIFYNPPENLDKSMTELVASKSGFEKLDDKFGVLSGKYVRKDIANDLKASYDKVYGTLFGKSNGAFIFYKNLLNAWKKSKTVYNMKAHVNNLVSNLALMHLNGFNPATLINEIPTMKNANKYSILRLKNDLGTISTKEKAEFLALRPKMKYYSEAYDAGLFGRGRIADVSSGKSNIKGVIGDVARVAEDMYQAEDNIARMAVFSSLRKQGKSIEEAKALTNKFLPDYTTYMPPAIRALKDSGVAPFISWSYYVLPNMIKQIGSGGGSARFITALGLYYAVQEISDKLNNFDERAIPKDQIGKHINLFRKGDTVTRLKIDRMVPYLEFARNPLSSMQVLQSPLLQLGYDIQNISNSRHVRQIYNDMPVTLKNKPKSAQAYDYLKYIVNQYTPMPSQAMSGLNLIESLARSNEKRKTNKTYVPRSSTQEVLNFLGINTSNYSQRESLKQKRRNEERLGKK